MGSAVYPRTHSSGQTLLSRRNVLVLTGLCLLPRPSAAQMSQRVRQVRERRACEQDLPTCRPEIRAQLEAERRRIRYGLTGLALGASVLGVLLWKRNQDAQRDHDAQLGRLHRRMADIGGKSPGDQAKSDGDEIS